MNRETAWRDVARIIKNRIELGVTVAAWYASIMTGGVLIQGSQADAYLATNPWAVTIVILLWLAGGFAIGRFAAWAVFRGLPDPDASA